MTEKPLEFLHSGPETPDIALVLAHGAGAGMRSPFMEFFASGLGTRGLAVYRFEFPYMAKARSSGQRRAPDRQPVLLQSWRDQVAVAAAHSPC